MHQVWLMALAVVLRLVLEGRNLIPSWETPFSFEYIHYDAPFQYLVGLSCVKFSRLANETVKNCLYHTI